MFRKVNKQNLDYVVSKDGKRTQTILLHQRIRLYNNPFKPMKNSFLVLCDAQFDDSDMDEQLGRNAFLSRPAILSIR